jgi:FkbM family methyltransferase
MSNILIKIVRKFLSLFYGRIRSQELFREIHLIGIRGLHFGYGGAVKNSGEIFAMNYIKGRVPQNAVIFDVGANEGDFSKEILRIFDNNVVLHCFEPSETVFKLLQNRIKNQNVTFHRVGFGEKKETKALFTHSEHSGLSSLYNRRLSHHNVIVTETETVDIVPLDTFCPEKNIHRIDFLKLDIEGHEFFALKGAENMIRENKIKFIQFEFGGSNIDSRTFFQDFWYLLNEKYRLYRIVKDGLYPIDKYHENLEIFATINYLAELRNVAET